MTITGNVKFLDINLIDEDTTFTFTSASTALANRLFDNQRTPQLVSSGSDDVTPEVWEFVFASNTVDRIYIDNHNIDDGSIKYWDGFSFVDFSPAIAFSSNTDTTSYFEVTQVTTTRIQLIMDTTQIVDDEKRVGEFRVFNELGLVVVNPSNFRFEFDDIGPDLETSKGSNIHVSFSEKYRADIDFNDSDATDMTLFRSLKDRSNPFYIFPGGGVDKTQEGFRLRDMFFVNFINNFTPELKSQLFDIGTVLNMEISEV